LVFSFSQHIINITSSETNLFEQLTVAEYFRDEEGQDGESIAADIAESR
jgi:hypothetical protein